MSRIISASEVKKHQGPKSTWIIIHNNVYDVTDYVEEHPGGVEAIMEVAGGDGTQGFEDVAHSDDAREVLAQFKIGTLPPKERTSIPVCKVKKPRKPSTVDKEKEDSVFAFSNSKYSLCGQVQQVCRQEQIVIVPRESGNLKWALMALAGALIVGIVLKKYYLT